MTAREERPSPERLARLGAEVFDRQILPGLRPEDEGKFVAVDVDSAEFEVDEDDFAAVARLRARLPNAEIWLARAGFPTAYQIRQVR